MKMRKDKVEKGRFDEKERYSEYEYYGGNASRQKPWLQKVNVNQEIIEAVGTFLKYSLRF